MIDRRQNLDIRHSSIILYELNEVPTRVIETYISRNPNSSLSLLSKSFFCSTFTPDEGELHPWSTWPTLHRGDSNVHHEIRLINQDLTIANQSFPPIWTKLAAKGISIGVFGSLQSFPPLNDPNVKFFLPDTFSPSTEAHPKSLSLFQRFNLSLSKRNKAVSSGFKLSDLLLYIQLLLKGIVPYSSAISILKQLFLEVFDSSWKARRPFLQAIISFPVFKKYLNNSKPSFSSYFTNHVAGAMHRYWFNLYPDDFSPGFSPFQKSSAFTQSAIMDALTISDRHIRSLMKYCDKNNATLIVASSMGQAAVEKEYISEPLLADYVKLLSFLELNLSDYSFVPAMQPDICFVCKTESALQLLQKRLTSLLTVDGQHLFVQRYSSVSLSLNLSLQRIPSLTKSPFVFSTGRPVALADIGVTLIIRDQGTGYHVPSGSLMVYGPGVHAFRSQKQPIDTTSIVDILMNLVA